ncbi:MAG: DUF559 domain-containing protein [Bacillus sp. (in: firmicutes)]
MVSDLVNSPELDTWYEASKRLDQVYFFQNIPILWVELDDGQHETTIEEDAQKEEIVKKWLPQINLLRFNSKEIRSDKQKVSQIIIRAYEFLTEKHLLEQTSYFLDLEHKLLDLDNSYVDILNAFETTTASYKLKNGTKDI